MRRWSRDLPVYMKMSEVILVAVSNIFYFYPYLVKWSNLTNIFRMGWNHQLVMFKKIWESFPSVAGKSMFDKIWIVECDIQHTNKKKDKLAKQKPQNIRSTLFFLQNLFFLCLKLVSFFFPRLILVFFVSADQVPNPTVGEIVFFFTSRIGQDQGEQWKRHGWLGYIGDEKLPSM